MDQTFLQKAETLLIKHEGLRLRPYRCTSGKLTIGVGRNLEDCGITEQEAKELLQNDILRCELELITNIPDIYNNLSENRKLVLLDMCFNIGIKGLLQFKTTLGFIKSEEYEKAANQMLTTKWAKQTGARAIELSQLMRKG